MAECLICKTNFDSDAPDSVFFVACDRCHEAQDETHRFGVCPTCLDKVNMFKEVEARVKEMEARLQFDPGGSDKIDEIEQAIIFLRHDEEIAKSRVKELEEALNVANRLRSFDTGTIPLPKGLMLEYIRLDNMWQKLVGEKMTAETMLDELMKFINELNKNIFSKLLLVRDVKINKRIRELNVKYDELYDK